MKNEQEIVRSVFDAYIRDLKATSTKKDRPTFDMLEEVKNRAIKALEQQPSDDCVSRAEMLKYQQYLHGKMSNEENHKLWEFIKDLPSVTPTHKQGKWDKGYGYPDGAYWKCSWCNELIKVKIPMHFCSNCGADMRGNESGL